MLHPLLFLLCWQGQIGSPAGLNCLVLEALQRILRSIWT